MWSWLGYMNPHKLSWGFAANFPFAQIVALTTMGAMVMATGKIKMSMPWNRESILLLLFVLWMFITTQFAFYTEDAWAQWDKVWKIQLFTFITMMLIKSREKVMWMLWIIVISIGLYGAKGGIFTVLTGGRYMVWGPATTFIGGNNEIGLAMIMTIPWVRYFQLVAKEKWQRVSMGILTLLMIIAIFGTQSRGALVSMAIMFSFMFTKSIKNFTLLMLMGIFLFGVVQFMPDTWHDRMGTIQNYEEDASAMGRINAWMAAVNLAIDNPVLGGGFEVFQVAMFEMYAPDPSDVHDAHSIFFEVLAEHGFVGFFMALLLGFFALFSSRKIMKITKDDKDRLWMYHLGSMMQVSLVGYASAGAFLGLAYFDLYYALIALVVVCKKMIEIDTYNDNDPGINFLNKLPKVLRPPGL